MSANIAVFVPHVGCPNRCSFCDQHAITGEVRVPNGAFVKNTCEVALSEMRVCGRNPNNAQLAFFGGSFTAIPRERMLELLDAVQPFLGADGFGGIRISTRPDALEGDMLAVLASRGVRAIELGAQSMNDTVLQKNRRGHTAADIEAASQRIQAHGIELGLQMMTGLYGDSDDGAYETARRLAALSPATVRIYPTVVLRGTYLAELMQSGAYTPPALEAAVHTAASLIRFFEQHNIAVIRVGLHASREVEAALVGGAYHPALRELCEARLFFNAMEEALAQSGITGGDICIQVAQGCISKAAGQQKSNRIALRERGFRATITENTRLCGRQILVERR